MPLYYYFWNIGGLIFNLKRVLMEAWCRSFLPWSPGIDFQWVIIFESITKRLAKRARKRKVYMQLTMYDKSFKVCLNERHWIHWVSNRRAEHSLLYSENQRLRAPRSFHQKSKTLREPRSSHYWYILCRITTFVVTFMLFLWKLGDSKANKATEGSGRRRKLRRERQKKNWANSRFSSVMWSKIKIVTVQ